MVEQHLRHLRGFARAGRRGHDQPPVFPEAGHELLLDFIDWQAFRHEAAMLNRIGWI